MASLFIIEGEGPGAAAPWPKSDAPQNWTVSQDYSAYMDEQGVQSGSPRPGYMKTPPNEPASVELTKRLRGLFQLLYLCNNIFIHQ